MYIFFEWSLVVGLVRVNGTSNGQSGGSHNQPDCNDTDRLVSIKHVINRGAAGKMDG